MGFIWTKEDVRSVQVWEILLGRPPGVTGRKGYFPQGSGCPSAHREGSRAQHAPWTGRARVAGLCDL